MPPAKENGPAVAVLTRRDRRSSRARLFALLSAPMSATDSHPAASLSASSASAPCAAPGFRASPVSTRSGAGRSPGPSSSAAVVLDLKRVPAGLPIRRPCRRSSARRCSREILATAHVGHRVDFARRDRHASTSARRRSAPCAGPSPPCPARPTWRSSTATIRRALPCQVEAIIKGDATIASIAAASIVAKVVRDRLMARLGAIYPAYGFDTNAGYGDRARISRRWRATAPARSTA